MFFRLFVEVLQPGTFVSSLPHVGRGLCLIKRVVTYEHGRYVINFSFREMHSAEHAFQVTNASFPYYVNSVGLLGARISPKTV